jgi:hypothetical protein
MEGQTSSSSDSRDSLRAFYLHRAEQLSSEIADKSQTLRRLEAQRNDLNQKGTQCRHDAMVLLLG